MKKFLYIVTFIALTVLFGHKASAATMNVVVPKSSFAVGDTFSADIRIDTDAGINAAQATVQFPKDILQIASVDTSGSVFSFWIQGPTFSNADGTVSFVAGSVSGFTGKSLLVLRLNFKVKGVGQGTIDLPDAAITASDGTGTDVLSGVNGASISAGGSAPATPNVTTPPVTAPSPVTPPVVAPPVVSVPTAPPAPVPNAPLVVTPPVQIVRTPAPAAGTPIKPQLNVSLYPDPQVWHNESAVFLVRWTLPMDVSDVATIIDKSPGTNPTKSEGLFDNKIFAALGDGVWYLHVRFKNSVGWGPTANYRLAIDTLPPLPFKIIVEGDNPTADPSPAIDYEASDRYSNIDHYVIRVGNGNPIATNKSKYQLPLLPPGNHTILVKAIDGAKNSTETTLQLQILPIAAPVITAFSRSVFADEDGLFIGGNSLPDVSVNLALKLENGVLVYSTTASSTHAGTWVEKISQSFPNGKYYIEATAEDTKGALSFPVKSDIITIHSRPFLTIFGLEISEFWFFFVIILLMIGVFVAGWYTRHIAKEQRGRKTLIAERELVNSYSVIKKDVDKCLEKYDDGVVSEVESGEIKFLLERVKKNIDKTQKYVVQNVKEIQD